MGAQDWIKVLDGIQSKNPNDLFTLPNGDLILGGFINDQGQYFQSSGLLIRTDPNGNVIWEKRIGKVNQEGNFTHSERIEAITLTTDGSIIVVGTLSPPTPNSSAASDILIAKYDLNGTELWRKYLNWGGSDNAYGIAAMPGGNFVVCGNTNSFNANMDGFLLNMNPDGNVLWTKYYDVANTEDWLYDVILTRDQHLVTVGTSQLEFVGNRTLAIKTDLDGNQDWLSTYDEYSIKANAVVEQKNGHYGIGGQGYNLNSSFDNLVMEIDGNGSEIWGDGYHAPSNVPDELFDLLPCAEGGYAGVGMSGVNPFDGYHVLRVDADGDVLKALYLFDGSPDYDFAKSLYWAGDGGLIVTGARLIPGENYDLVLTHFSDLGCTQPTSTATNEQVQLDVRVSPNPAIDLILVEIPGLQGSSVFNIFDLTGRLIFRTISDQTSLSIPCQDFPGGIYFYSLQLEDGVIAHGQLQVQR